MFSRIEFNWMQSGGVCILPLETCAIGVFLGLFGASFGTVGYRFDSYRVH